ncbi:hypothetical protein BGZ92_009679, partial [Podila epicladia]
YPYCVASNGNTLYAVAGIGSTANDETIILAKSNTAPGSLAALSWTAVGSTFQNTLNTFPGNGMDSNNAVCYVDSQGVFTLLTMSSKPPGKSTVYKPAGYQYNPATNAWTNITMSADYKWSLDSGALFEVGVGSSSTLMHIHTDIDMKDGSSIAVYNPSTRTMTEGSTPWIAKGSPGRFAANSHSAYITSYDITTGGAYLNIGAITASGAPPASPKVVALNVTGCEIFGMAYRTIVREGTYYLYCKGTSITTPRWYTYDGTALSAPTVSAPLENSGAHSMARGFLPLGPAGSPATWAFMYSILGLYGVSLNGGQGAVEWETANYQFNISGLSPGSRPGSGAAGGKGEEGSTSGEMSVGTLAGIIGGAVMIVGAIIFILRRRKRIMSKPVQLEQQPHKEPSNYPIPEPPNFPIPEPLNHSILAPPNHHIPVPVEQPQKEEPYSHQGEEPYPHQKEEPYSEQAPPMAPTVFVPQDATKYYPPPATASFVQTNNSSPKASSPQINSPGNPSSLSPQSFTNSTLANSEMTSIAGSPYHNAASLAPTSPQQYPQPQNPAALPVNQRPPQMYPAVAAPQFYGEPSQARPAQSQSHPPALQMYPTVTAPQFYGDLDQERLVSSQAHPPALQMYPAATAPQFYGEPDKTRPMPSLAHSPAPQTYPAVTAPQFYGEPDQARPVPSQVHSPAPQTYPAVTAPQFYGEPSQAYPPPPVSTIAASQDYGLTQAYPAPPQVYSPTPEYRGPQDRNEYAQ